MTEEKLNPFKMKKADLLKLFKGRCKHGHTYAEHPACYLKEKEDTVKVGYIDIESSQLKGNFGIMISYAIKERGSDTIYSNTITKKDIDGEILDRDLVKHCVKDMKKFDILMGYYSTRFDIPFIRTRAMYWGIDFPMYGELKHKDIWYMVRNKMNLHSNRLEVACRHLGIEGKTHLDGSQWTLATAGNKKALEYVLDHNKKDVIILEKLHNRIKEFVRDTTRSI
jgi:uncharacterized protein YprB with RNaseH-like and TPR domain